MGADPRQHGTIEHSSLPIVDGSATGQTGNAAAEACPAQYSRAPGEALQVSELITRYGLEGAPITP
jgi:hypothetical protein